MWENPPAEGTVRASDVGMEAFANILLYDIEYDFVTDTYATLQEMGFVVPEPRTPVGSVKRCPQPFQARYWQTIGLTVLRLDPACATLEAVRDAAGDAFRRGMFRLPLSPVGLIAFKDLRDVDPASIDPKMKERDIWIIGQELAGKERKAVRTELKAIGPKRGWEAELSESGHREVLDRAPKYGLRPIPKRPYTRRKESQ
jgi:hypothetical protein